MKPKTIVILIFIAIILIGGGLYLFVSKKQTSTVGSGNNAAPGGGNEVVLPAVQVLKDTATSTMLSIGTQNGTVRVDNFYLSNPSITDGGETVIIVNSADYIITYDTIDSSFWIGIDPGKFTETRPVAEQDFISKLGVNNSAACKLNVSEGTFYSATSTYAGQSFPLSFCGFSATSSVQ